jgi:CIC family chloride channel protein
MTSTSPSRASRWRNATRWARRRLSQWLHRVRNGEYVFLLGVAALIGVLGGASAIIFDLAIRAVARAAWSRAFPTLEMLQATPAWKILLIPAAGGLAVGLITTFFVSEAKGHGVPEVIKAVAVNGGKIRGRVAVAKTVASALTIGTGGSAGQEGPIIQIGAAIGSRLGQTIGMSRRCLRTLVGCGAAAGIAATFNAPIAGALFAGEVILGEFGLAQFSPIVISSVLATVTMRAWRGDAPVFAPPPCTFAGTRELLPYALLGLACGLVSLLYIYLNDRIQRLFSRIRLPGLLLPALGGLLVGAAALRLPQILGNGHALANEAFTWTAGAPGPLLLLAVLLLAKMVATAVTLGSGGSGGVFSPALTLGALLGAGVGLLAEPWLGAHYGGTAAYALAGMGGLVAGSMLAPITAILMVFEITGSYSIILPVMVTAILSTALVMKLARNRSIYTLALFRDGIPLLRGSSPDLLRRRRVRDHMAPALETIRPDAPATGLVDLMLSSPADQFYVLNAADSLVGTISLDDARRILLSPPSMLRVLMAEDLMRRDIPTVTPDDTLSSSLAKFSTSGLSELPVIRSEADRRLLGTLAREDVLNAYQDEILKADATSALSGSLAALSDSPVEIAPGVALAEWNPPPAYDGKTLEQAQFPRTLGLHILLIKRFNPGGGMETLLPDADTVLTPDDSLILIGPTRTIPILH